MQVRSKNLFLTFLETILKKIFETNSSFHVKQGMESSISVFQNILLVLIKFSCWRGDWGLGYNSMKF